MFFRFRTTVYISLTMLLVLSVLAACGGEAMPTPDIDATVEARVDEEMTDAAEDMEEMVEATVEMQVAMTMSPLNTPVLSEDAAPDFAIIVSQGEDLLGGDNVAMASLLGQKPVVLNFWAAECPPCRAELPEFQEFHEEYGDRILVLAIDLGQFTNQGTPEQGRELLAELGVHMPAGYTEDAQILPKYKVLGLPTTIFINADGSIHNKWTGALNKDSAKRAHHCQGALAVFYVWYNFCREHHSLKNP